MTCSFRTERGVSLRGFAGTRGALGSRPRRKVHMWRALMAASLGAGGATMDRVGQTVGLSDGRPPAPDTGLEAIMSAAPIACPNGRTLAGANDEAFGPQHGVTAQDIAVTPVASDPSRAVRMRRLVI